MSTWKSASEQVNSSQCDDFATSTSRVAQQLLECAVLKEHCRRRFWPPFAINSQHGIAAGSLFSSFCWNTKKRCRKSLFYICLHKITNKRVAAGAFFYPFSAVGFISMFVMSAANFFRFVPRHLPSAVNMSRRERTHWRLADVQWAASIASTTI